MRLSSSHSYQKKRNMIWKVWKEREAFGTVKTVSCPFSSFPAFNKAHQWWPPQHQPFAFTENWVLSFYHWPFPIIWLILVPSFSSKNFQTPHFVKRFNWSHFRFSLPIPGEGWTGQPLQAGLHHLRQPTPQRRDVSSGSFSSVSSTPKYIREPIEI